MRLVRDIDDGDAWVVARFDALAGAKLPAEVANQLPPINWFSAKGFVDSGLEGQLRAKRATSHPPRTSRKSSAVSWRLAVCRRASTRSLRSS